MKYYYLESDSPELNKKYTTGINYVPGGFELFDTEEEFLADLVRKADGFGNPRTKQEYIEHVERNQSYYEKPCFVHSRMMKMCYDASYVKYTEITYTP